MFIGCFLLWQIRKQIMGIVFPDQNWRYSRYMTFGLIYTIFSKTYRDYTWFKWKGVAKSHDNGEWHKPTEPCVVYGTTILAVPDHQRANFL